MVASKLPVPSLSSVSLHLMAGWWLCLQKGHRAQGTENGVR